MTCTCCLSLPPTSRSTSDARAYAVEKDASVGIQPSSYLFPHRVKLAIQYLFDFIVLDQQGRIDTGRCSAYVENNIKEQSLVQQQY